MIFRQELEALANGDRWVKARLLQTAREKARKTGQSCCGTSDAARIVAADPGASFDVRKYAAMFGTRKK